VKRTLLPASANLRAARTFTSMSWSSVFGRSLISLISTTVCLRLVSRCFFFLFVFVLAEIEDLADRGRALRVDLDQVEPGLLSTPDRVAGGQHPEVRAVFCDDTHLGHADAVVDADLRSPGLPAESSPVTHVLMFGPCSRGAAA
jgi:hypothetical protein